MGAFLLPAIPETPQSKCGSELARDGDFSFNTDVD